LTTVVLACGLVVTVFSDLPSLRLFGWLSAFSMIAALVAALFILRPTSMFLINLSEKTRGVSHAKPAESQALLANKGCRPTAAEGGRGRTSAGLAVRPAADAAAYRAGEHVYPSY